jgi:hypothetical protein
MSRQDAVPGANLPNVFLVIGIQFLALRIQELTLPPPAEAY